ncbi:MAG TPA: MBL fold metallo-hydrolase [Candidatus Acidoferrales bacterium]|nr:MBL fold metallo-hydrolase [Candidatus Acidoferrales bacterium]
MRRFPLSLTFAALLGVVAFSATVMMAQEAASKASRRTLDIYFIDTEGGQSTLFVTPSGESMLVDTGFAGNQGMPDANATNATGAPITRDADRISAVFKQAGVTVLDWLVISHYHGDHVGNAAELAKRIPIRHFLDHGPFTVELQPNRSAAFVAYMGIRDKARAITAKPGYKIPLAGLDVQVISSAGELITAPLQGAPGAGLPNPLCRDARLKDQDPTPENFESVGIVVRYGGFRLLDLGDLTWNQEHALACPNNLLGTFDVFHTTRHGDPHAGAPQLVHAIRARVAVMNNGERKGGDPSYWQIVHEAPGLVDFWQLHRSAAGGADHNSPEQFLANLNEIDHGHNLKISVRADGSFAVTNERNGFSREYPARIKTAVSSR